ncbi:MAG: DUF2267 domain-containing protein [Alphaproteobacteria bacterium]|nr:DUF2267 domain-containing protein [Alphaproteobacteria bacterium]
MTTTSLPIFDKTLQTTHRWLDEIMEVVGPDRHLAWHVLSAVLHALRDRLPMETAAHLGSQLPVPVRGLYYDQWHPAEVPEKLRTREAFLARLGAELRKARPLNLTDAAQAVFQVPCNHLDKGQLVKVRNALPKGLRALWPKNCIAVARDQRRAQGDGTHHSQ